MKIIFEHNKNMSDYELYQEYLDDLENLENKSAFVLRDEKTEIKPFKPGYKEDLKKIFLIVQGNNFFVTIKGNLSFDQTRKEIRFYPIFINKRDLTKSEKYWLEIDLININDMSLSRFERLKNNEKIYDELVSSIKQDKYIPTNASKEWKDFIEPYEYYVDLKFQLLKQDFLMFENFEKRFTKVILIDNKHKEYKNYFEKKLYIETYEDNRQKILFLDFEKYKWNFSKEFLKNNIFNIAKKVEFYNKEQFEFANKRAFQLNQKFKANAGKSTFFITKNIYSPEDLKKDGKMSKNDIELETELAYVSDLKEEYSIIDINSVKIKKMQDNFKEITIPNESFARLVDYVLKQVNTTNDSMIKIDKILESYKKNINSKINLIEDNGINYVNDLLYEINNFELFNFENLINELLDYKAKIMFDEEKLKKEKDNEVELINDKFEKKISYLDEKESDFKNEMQNLKEEWNSLINEVDDKYKIKINLYNDKLKKNIGIVLDLNINRIIPSINRSIERIVETLDSGVVRTVEYVQEINIVFNFKNQEEEHVSNNFYMLNTGDMVLVDTIRRINNMIKSGQKMNNDILEKIIGKQKMNPFNINIINDRNKKFYPEEYMKLNSSQKRAFKLAIDEYDPISIIQGPPGTGKTEVITNIIKFYRNKGDKVILSSQTNVAIKNVLDKLCSSDKVENSVIIPWLTTKSKENYSLSNLESTWYKKIINNVTQSNMKFVEKWKSKLPELTQESDIFKDILISKDPKVYAATTTTSMTLPGRGYDAHLKNAKVLIIDEVSKSILPEILRYALQVKKVILVGDYKQLNPIFDIRKENIEENFDNFKFNKLKEEIQSGIFYKLATDAKLVNRIETLDTNYRSVPGVLDAYNIFYSVGENKNGLLGYRTFKEYSDNYKFNNSNYFDSNHSFYFIDVQGANEERRGTSRFNKGEVKALIDTLHDMANTLEQANEKDVAIIFPYAAQINLFSSEMRKQENRSLRDCFRSIEWDTVDSFQGSEANIVFLSTVVTNTNENNFLSDFRRINVSMSRAKDLLVVLGNKIALKHIEIGGEGIETKRYFNDILNPKTNEYLKIINIKKVGN